MKNTAPRKNADPSVQSAKREAELGHDATRTVGSWTRYLVADEIERGGELASAATALEAPQWPSVVRETFSDLYGAPGDEPLPVGAGGEGSAWVRQLVETISRAPEWTDLKARTQGDEWAAGLAVSTLAASAHNQLKDLLPKSDERGTGDTVKALQDMLNELQEDAGGVPTRAQSKTLDKFGERLEAATAEAGLASVDATDAAASLAEREMQRTIRSMAATVAGTAIAEIESTRAAMRGLGIGAGSNGGFKVDAPAREVIEALKSNAELKRILKIAGRLRAEAARKQASKTNYARNEINSITMGSDLARLVPSELVYLADDDLELVLFRKLTERSALEYELTGREIMTRGPIVLALDESGSMSGARNEWAKAVALTLADLAVRQKREFVLVHFDGTIRRVDYVDHKTPISLPALIEMVCHFSGGGTNILAALEKAERIIEAAKAKSTAMRDADVILISDGADYSTQNADVFDRFKAYGVQLHGIAIARPFGGTLRENCASYVELDGAGAAFKANGAIDAVLSI